MADFFTNLWNSVFTPGATPTLLIATNVAFAALQLVLAALLIATHSIHFAILSVLCAGLWYSINWFASELGAAQAKEQEAERLRKKSKTRSSDWKGRGEVNDSADDEGENTEVEDAGMRASAASLSDEPTKEDERVREEIMEAIKSSGMANMGGSASAKGDGAARAAVASASGSQATGGASVARQRRADESDRSGEISTDSEWEKVDDDR